MLTALATARARLSADQLARALGWQLPRTSAVIAAAQDNAEPGSRDLLSISHTCRRLAAQAA